MKFIIKITFIYIINLLNIKKKIQVKIKKNKILVASHDAGGANILSSYIKYNPGNYEFILTGPAKKIFFKKLKIKQNKKKINLNNIEKIFLSTSWESKLELKILKEAKEKQIPTYSFLDHWTNYKKRFLLNKKIFLPNKIIVTDNYAYKIAKKEFKKTKIIKVKNFYLMEVKNKLKFSIRKKQNKKITKILYLTEPITDTEKVFKNRINPNNEFKLLNNFLAKLKGCSRFKLTIRLHPQEYKLKYKNYINNSSYKIYISKKKDLANDINSNDLIVGAHTYALIFGLIAKKKVFTSVPKTHRCDLPFKNIKRLDKLKNYL